MLEHTGDLKLLYTAYMQCEVSAEAKNGLTENKLGTIVIIYELFKSYEWRTFAGSEPRMWGIWFQIVVNRLRIARH